MINLLYLAHLIYIFAKMGAMCGQSSDYKSCLTGTTSSSKIAVYGPPKTGKSSLLSYLFNK